jgi:hypothetical protein
MQVAGDAFDVGMAELVVDKNRIVNECALQ